MIRVSKEELEILLSCFPITRQEDGIDYTLGPYSRYYQDDWLVAEVYRDGYENQYFISTRRGEKVGPRVYKEKLNIYHLYYNRVVRKQEARCY